MKRLSFGRDQELAELMEQVGGLLPANAAAAAGRAGTERHDNEISIHAGRTEMSGIFYFNEEEKMMEIYGTIHFRLILPHYPRLSAGAAAGSLFAAIPRIATDCPYPRHGFLCWGADGTCLRSRMNEINEKKEDNNHDERSSE